MKKEEYQFEFEIFDSAEELSGPDSWLVNEARGVTEAAYAPYSNFNVGAVAKMADRKSTRLNSSHSRRSRMPSSA